MVSAGPVDLLLRSSRQGAVQQHIRDKCQFVKLVMERGKAPPELLILARLGRRLRVTDGSAGAHMRNSACHLSRSWTNRLTPGGACIEPARNSKSFLPPAKPPSCWISAGRDILTCVEGLPAAKQQEQRSDHLTHGRCAPAGWKVAELPGSQLCRQYQRCLRKNYRPSAGGRQFPVAASTCMLLVW